MVTMKQRTYQLGRRAESAEETRRRLVQVTFELHSEQGIAATSMKQIADRAGVGVGTVYHHFATLDDTVMACGQMVMATYPPPTEATFSGVPGMRERLARLARALFESGADAALPPEQRMFAYLPFQHSEDRADQALAVRLTSAQLAMLWEGIDWRRPDWGAPPARVG